MAVFARAFLLCVCWAASPVLCFVLWAVCVVDVVGV